MRKWTVSVVVSALLLVIAVLVAPRTSRAGGNLAKARADAASKAFTLAKSGLSVGATTTDVACAWSLRWYQAEKAAGTSAAAAEHLARMQALESEVVARVKTGAAGALDQATATYYCADAEALAAGQ
jgi:hypothetical protein